MSNLRPITFLVVLLTLSRTGLACTCPPPKSDEPEAKIVRAQMENADIVFRGKIVAHNGGAAVFLVNEQWKGNLKKYVELEWRRGDTGDCNGFWPGDLKVGNELVVFATKGDLGRYRTSICRPTTLVSGAQKLLDALGRGKAPAH